MIQIADELKDDDVMDGLTTTALPTCTSNGRKGTELLPHPLRHPSKHPLQTKGRVDAGSRNGIAAAEDDET